MKNKVNYLVTFNDGNEQCIVATFGEFEDAVRYAKKRMRYESDGYYNVLIADKAMRNELRKLQDERFCDA